MLDQAFNVFCTIITLLVRKAINNKTGRNIKSPGRESNLNFTFTFLCFGFFQLPRRIKNELRSEKYLNIRNMFDQKRRETSIVYLSCLVATLLVVFLPLPSLIKLLLLLILMLVQFCASCWYTLSYIPFGRRAALRILRNALGLEEASSSSSTLSYSGIFGNLESSA